mmetsp:Transcript_1128/g.2406  ORF Transcript_1128/g.2406 Transcript_1128/m.2406 type:complete len:315 (+) Transcript_1128:343-1287(+)
MLNSHSLPSLQSGYDGGTRVGSIVRIPGSAALGFQGIPTSPGRSEEPTQVASIDTYRSKSHKQLRTASLESLLGRKAGGRSLHSPNEYKKPYTIAYANIVRERNLKRVDALFRDTDADSSGMISMEEWYNAMKKPSAQTIFAALGVQPHQAGVLFQAFDMNQDGELSHEEFTAGLRKLLNTDDDGNSRDIDLEMLRAANLRLHEEDEERPVVPNRLPEVKLQRAFVHSAIAQALNPANASVKVKNRQPNFGTLANRIPAQAYALPAHHRARRVPKSIDLYSLPPPLSPFLGSSKPIHVGPSMTACPTGVSCPPP